MKILFIAFILFWSYLGWHSVYECKEDKVHYEMIAFLVIAPLIPLVAKLFGIL